MLQILCFGSNAKSASEIGRTFVLQTLRFLSYKHTCGELSLVYKSVGELMDETAGKYPDRTAYFSVYQDQKISFRELKEKADKFAAGVLAHGMEKGDRVGIWAPNSLEWYISSFALAKAGLISVYMNPSYEANDIKHCLNKVGVKMLVTTESFKNQNYPEILSQIAPEIGKSEPGKLVCKEVPTLKSVICISKNDIPGMIPFERVFESANEESTKKLQDIQKLIIPDDASNIQFTSGTTGSPKGAVLTHFHIVNNSLFTAHRQNFYEKHHIMCFMGPLFHAMGSVIAILSCLHSGTSLVVPEGAFSPSKAVMAIEKEKCTILLGTPTMYIDILKIYQEKEVKPKTPELAITGGAFAPAQLFHDIIHKLGCKRVASVYGLTETGPITFMSRRDDSEDKTMTTVGFIMDHTEAKVVDDRGYQVPWDHPGELWVRGYNVIKDYWDDKQRTKDAITEDHWFKTGDQFSMSRDGYGRVVGRIKDMIIRGGENIYPADIEEFLITHPEILDVQVVGVPDKRLGEKVCACIRLMPNAELSESGVKEFCKGKIAVFKIPEYVIFMKGFPKTSSGKVQKFKLRQEAMEILKIKEEK